MPRMRGRSTTCICSEVSWGRRRRPFAVASVALLVALAGALIAAGLRGRAAVRRALDVLRDPWPPGSLDEEKLSDVTTLAARMRLGLEVTPGRLSRRVRLGCPTDDACLVLGSHSPAHSRSAPGRASARGRTPRAARQPGAPGAAHLLLCLGGHAALPSDPHLVRGAGGAGLRRDRGAATRAPLELASALVSIRRSMLARPSRAPAPVPLISFLAPRDRASFEQRVRRLVAFSEISLDTDPS